MSTSDATDLNELARLCGLQSSYLGADGSLRRADPQVLVALLRVLGESLDAPHEARGLIHDRRRRVAQQVIEPVIVVRDGQPLTFALNAPAHLDARAAWFTVTFEDGSVRRTKLLADAEAPEHFVVAGETFHRYHVSSLPGGDPLPYGYHSLLVDLPGAARATSSVTSLIVSAPRCPRAPRGWGVFMPQHALRSASDWGVGSYSDLAELGKWVRSLGGDMMGGLPLYPTFDESPIDPSPYRPVSRLAYNELFIDPTRTPELATSQVARDLLASTPFQRRLETVRAASFVDYEEVARLHRQILEPLAATLFSSNSPRRAAFEGFMVRHPELMAYAQFRTAIDTLGRDVVAKSPVIPEFAPSDPTWRYHAYGQWVASEQLSAAVAGVGFYADLPVGSHPEGFDPYWSPRSFLTSAKCGSPPDPFFEGGQDWGFPPPHPEGIREDGYHYLRAMLERALHCASVLRIDHVMGLQRLYIMAEDADPEHGAYLTYRPDEMHAVVSLEAHRHGAVVVGEDLGTVPEGVRERMAEDRMLRSWVFELESTIEDPLPEPTTGVLATLATHDIPRFASFLWGHDIDDTESRGELSPEKAKRRRVQRAKYREALFSALHLSALSNSELTDAARRRCLEHLAQSTALLVQVDLEELWGEDQPQNRPGTVEGNWRRRARITLEEARGDEAVVSLLRLIDALRKDAV
ncbi:MAG: MalQ [Acidimicrobiaceae bacterium]|nr:MalQ [Acidimicrobiaceae bacterium]